MAEAVDDFVSQNVAPPLQEVVGFLRALMAECAPHATEKMSYGLPMWVDRSTLAWISPTQRDITFSFTYGVTFEDPYGLLRGKAKHARFVKLRTVAGANQAALRDYIRQAVERDANR